MQDGHTHAFDLTDKRQLQPVERRRSCAQTPTFAAHNCTSDAPRIAASSFIWKILPSKYNHGAHASQGNGVPHTSFTKIACSQPYTQFMCATRAYAEPTCMNNCAK